MTPISVILLVFFYLQVPMVPMGADGVHRHMLDQWIERVKYQVPMCRCFLPPQEKDTKHRHFEIALFTTSTYNDFC